MMTTIKRIPTEMAIIRVFHLGVELGVPLRSLVFRELLLDFMFPTISSNSTSIFISNWRADQEGNDGDVVETDGFFLPFG